MSHPSQTAKKFRKKPVVIEAIQWDGTNTKDVLAFAAKAHARYRTNGDDEYILLKTLEGTMYVRIWDRVIKGVKGEFYPVKPEIFTETYEDELDEMQPGQGSRIAVLENALRKVEKECANYGVWPVVEEIVTAALTSHPAEGQSDYLCDNPSCYLHHCSYCGQPLEAHDKNCPRAPQSAQETQQPEFGDQEPDTNIGNSTIELGLRLRRHNRGGH